MVSATVNQLLVIVKTFKLPTYFIQSVYVGVGSVATETGLILINGCIHFFTPFNMAEGSTRARYVVAYTVEAVEGVVSFSPHFRELHL